ncbi:TonB-dependent receptor [Undibacterium sp. RTI2.1]|uniref:TonB-dependent receptor plug domain-containing protein n=1 Tax=unclassified Undibacterium TaxID=2630295 RepID=UPI002AB46BFD|nr:MULTISPECIES: TonB-dependent receptor [unclassified Undibacterium]MDY7537034.1 TonB-dependent receptor [Undibacterium sp. 5I1]MEB0030429.1 TonB-dependent receptor [Undibacterium sp. RTI2.1]MEB0115212.1 TonB-dependent receptor [Undibacterium sp. RTI2.2]MEB0229212.1 TonB-dependent receptor [Undibacterium sp. 10I3]MEB0256240.1 TonB-dependent receptor [Undibacterium sp. 5I1]
MSFNLLPFRLALLPLAIFIAFNPVAQAQQSTPVQADPQKTQTPAPAPNTAPANKEQIQKVEVSGAKGYDERRQDTATKIVVTQEDIIRYGDSTIADVLKRLPGITIGGVQGRGGDIRMRGLGSGYTQILLNGEPSPPGFSLDSLSPDLIERIEIIRAATAEYSTQAIAGAINIVLKRTVQTSQSELKIGGQEDGGKYGVNANWQVSDKAGKMSYSISGSLNHGQYERPSRMDEVGTDANGNVNLRRSTSIDNWGTFSGIGLSPRVNFNLDNGDTVTTQSFVNANRFSGNSTDSSVTSLGALPNYVSDRTQIQSEFAMLRTNLNWIHKMADSAKLDFKLGFNYNKRSSDVNTQGYDINQSEILDRKNQTSASDKGLTWGGKYTAPFMTDHALAIGWDGAYSKRNEARTIHDITTNGVTPLNLNEVFDASVNRIAVFAQDEWNVTKRWSVYAGLRWEGIDTKSTGNSYAEVNNRSSVFSPILQTLWKLPDSKNDQVRLGLTRTYKAPDTSSLIPRRYISENNSPTSPDSIGNPNLKPELAWGLDAAFEHYLPEGGLMSVSVFMRRIDDITRTQLSNVNGIWTNMPINDGQATTRGIEMEAKFPLRSVMKDAPAIDFRSNLSFNWSNLETVPGPNNRLDSQTPISANVGLDYKLDKIPLTIGGNLSFQDGGPVRLSANKTSYSVPKRGLDLYGLWKFNPKTNLRVSLANALHQDNINASSYADTFGSLTQTTTTPTTVAVRALLEMKM